MAGADLLRKKSTIGWLVAGGWCWFGVREKYYWLIEANRLSGASIVAPPHPTAADLLPCTRTPPPTIKEIKSLASTSGEGITVLPPFQIIDHLTFLISNLTTCLIQKNCANIAKFKSFLQNLY